jgi:hypothetical protein
MIKPITTRLDDESLLQFVIFFCDADRQTLADVGVGSLSTEAVAFSYRVTFASLRKRPNCCIALN